MTRTSSRVLCKVSPRPTWTSPPPSPAPLDVSPHTARGWGGMAVLRPRLPSAPCWCPCAASHTVAASCTPVRVCTRLALVLAVPACAPVSAAAPPPRLQHCKSFCISLFKLSSPHPQLSSRLQQSPPSRAGSPSPAPRPVRALRRGAPRARHGGGAPGWAARGVWADARRGHQREQSGMGWADTVGGKGRLIFLYSIRLPAYKPGVYCNGRSHYRSWPWA